MKLSLNIRLRGNESHRPCPRRSIMGGVDTAAARKKIISRQKFFAWPTSDTSNNGNKLDHRSGMLKILVNRVK